MSSGKSVRILLLLIFAVVSSLIVWSLLSRSRSSRNASPAEPLPRNVSRRSTQFEHAEYKLGNITFRVSSQTSTLTEEGVQHLEGVELEVYDSAARISDRVKGGDAFYDTGGKRVRFSGGVEIELTDGTRIHSEQLKADLEAQLLTIDERFSFEHGEVTGQGRALFYRIPQRLLEIHSGFELSLPGSAGDVKVEAGSGSYAAVDGRLELRDAVQVKGPAYQLASDRMDIRLTESRQVENVVSQGNARFTQGPQFFGGHEIRMAFDPVLRRLQSFEVLAEESSSASTPAVYEERSPAGIHHLEARRLTGRPAESDSAPSVFRLQKFEAEGEVSFQSSIVGIDSAEADQLAALFAADGSLKTLAMDRNVTVVRRSVLPPGQEQRLRSGHLEMGFDSAQQLEFARATDQVEFRVNDPHGFRHLSARDYLDIRYAEDGNVEEIRAGEDARLESRAGERSSSVAGQKMTAGYRAGLLRHLQAEGAVRVQQKEGAGLQMTESGRLELFYENGEMVRGVQSGNFHFTNRDASGSVEIFSDQGSYESASQVAVFSGDNQAKLIRRQAGGSDAAPTVTTADRFEFDRRQDRLVGMGKIASRLTKDGRSVLVQSGRMEADLERGWVEYLAQPILTEGKNRISAERVRIVDAEHLLLVERKVDSLLVRENSVEPYHVTAGQLRIDLVDNKALYEKNVVVVSKDMRLKAPSVELALDQAQKGTVKEVKAWGGVQIEANGRTVTGESASYDPDKEQLNVLGKPAQATDSKGGNVSGRQLTFFLTDDRLLIEGPSVKQQP